MGMPATTPQMSTGPVEPVPVAFIGRTSTLTLQDPAASLRRQVRECQAKLPPGWYIAAWFWDIESGGLPTDQRGHGSAHEQFTGIGIPRDGGLSDLLAEAASPMPRFAGVICEDIERSGRDTYYALQLEKQLTLAGIPLFATDEPIDVAGANATTVLVRRVKQGVAEWFRLQIKEKAWRGLREHSLAGWNIGTPPHGYAAERVPHPVPFKAAQGRTKTRLILDPDHAPAVAAIFTWRVQDRLGAHAIAQRLAADPDRYPPPAKAGVWTEAGRLLHLAQPQIHRPHGVRPHPQPPRRPDRRRPRRPMAMVTRTHPPRDHHPPVVGRRPGHRHRTLHQPRRHRRQHPPPDPPHLRAALPRAVPLLQTPHVRHHPHRHPLLGRRPRLLKHLLHLLPQPRRPPPDRTRRPPPHHLRPRRPPARQSSASSSPSACSDPTAPPCSPPTSPPPPPTTRPAATARPPPWPNGYARSTPPKTPTPAKSKPSPATTPPTPPSPPCDHASWPASPNSKTNAPTSTPS